MRDHTFEIMEYFARRNTQRLYPVPAQKSISLRVIHWLVPARVRLAIDLNAQLRPGAEEVEHVQAGGVLLAELQPAGSLTEGQPQAQLGRGQILAQRTGAVDRSARGFEHRRSRMRLPLHHAFGAVPLPVPGRYGVFSSYHIRNTPKRGASGIEALSVAASASPSTSRVCAGSMMPSSHSRAVA